MSDPFVLYGTLATDPEVRDGLVVAALETSFGDLEEILAELRTAAANELQTLQEGDAVALELVRDGGELLVVEVRPRYVRGFPDRR